MEDRVGRLEAQVAAMREDLARLEQRVGQFSVPRPTEEQPADALLLAPGALQPVVMQHWLALAGRTLVILGGAYLLRALTRSHVLPSQVGVGLGLLYGAPWLFLASRAGARGAHLDAFTHALATALIGYPLVWEATLRFQALSPVQSAVLLAALTAGALTLAALRELQGLAWVVTFGAIASAPGLAIATQAWAPYTVLAIAVGVGTLWLGYLRGWTALRWPAALIANLMMAVLTGRAVVSGSVRGVLILQFLMVAAYLGSFAVRTLFIGRQVIPFEVVQSFGVLTVAFGGAIYVIRSSSTNLFAVGVITLMLSAGGYLVAFAFVERRRHVANFLFYGLLALLFAVVGVALCAGAAVSSATYSTIAVAAGLLARRYRRQTLAVHALVYLAAGAAMSGLLTTSLLAVVAPVSAPWTPLTPVGLGVFAALAVVTLLPVHSPIESWGFVASIPRLLLVSLATLISIGVVINVVATVLAAGGYRDASVLATVRTAAMVLATLSLAWCARLEGGREGGWLVYPLIFVTGLKLVFVDFPQGGPETLFAALAMYGAALIAAPRLLRGSGT